MNPRRALRVLIEIERPTSDGWESIREVDLLRSHLRDDLENVCDIQLLVSNTNSRLLSEFSVWGIATTSVEPVLADEGIGPEIDCLSLRQAIATARRQGCSYIVVPNELLPYTEIVERQFHIRLGDLSFLRRFVEIFVRGFGVAWSFESSVFNAHFDHLYFSELQETIAEGFVLIHRLIDKGRAPDTETMRSLLYNRLPHVCYSRDQLLFYLLQREAELLGSANGQPFAFELNYHLNFYYILLYGALYHAAVVVNEVCQLGLNRRDVAAGPAYKKFQVKLQASFPALHGIFTSPEITKILTLLGPLRHLSAHRGSVAPAKLIRKPHPEPTLEELDAYLSETRRDWRSRDISDVPEAEEALWRLEHSLARLELMERNALDYDIVPVEIDGRSGYFHPFDDVTWLLRASMKILRRVMQECLKIV